MADYVEDYRRRGGKAPDSIESVARRNILPELGSAPVVKLTTPRLLDWHRAIAERPRRWRSRAGEVNVAAFDCKDAEAVRRRRATANRVLLTSRPHSITPGEQAWCHRTMLGAA
jgi:hypothetical protein